jgi:hypothetical protein
MGEALRLELTEIYQENNKSLEQLQKKKKEGTLIPQDRQAFFDRQLAIRQKFEQLIAKNDGKWPGFLEVGIKGSQAAFAVVQQSVCADKNACIAFKEKMMALIKAALQEKNAEPDHYAFLLDTVRLLRGIPQIYNTQKNPQANDWNEIQKRYKHLMSDLGLDPEWIEKHYEERAGG